MNTNDSRAPASLEASKAPWSDLIRDGRGLYSVLVVLGTVMQALQILVIAIIMPTVIADIGGAQYYTWPAMLYTIGSIVGGAAVAPMWTAFGGARKGYALSGLAFLLGTIGCAVAPDMGWLNAARLLQGFASGLVSGGSMALMGSLFPSQLRTRILAVQQGTFTASHLLGPVVGGLFAQMGWWRGSFWCMVPFLAAFAVIAWWKLPDGIGVDAVRGNARFPFLRLSVLSVAVFCIAMIGPVEGAAWRIAFVVAALALLWLTFRLDRAAPVKLYPSNPLSLRTTVGLTLWILVMLGLVQTAFSIFLPLLMQVVMGVSPVFASAANITLSFAWSTGSIAVAGWSGGRERLALRLGAVLMVAGVAGIVYSARSASLWLLIPSAFVFGIGVGMNFVHLMSRAMQSALKGEERVTAASLSSIRSVGMAFGAALVGVLATFAGLGAGTDPVSVRNALGFVFGFGLVPVTLSLAATFYLVHINSRRTR
jgi:MFS family permease